MFIASSIRELRDRLSSVAGRVVLVPTMGALHRGHGSLLKRGRDLAGDGGTLVASIFVNPTQFGPGEDFESYHRDLDGDAALCESLGVDLIFAPEPSEIYSADASIAVREGTLSKGLCGESRPTHFDGVCLVVLKLFNIVSPDIAVFGKKDYQQLAIIRRLVRDLDLMVEVVGAETVREDDGLAMSSRNTYLSADERAQAPALRKALEVVGEMVAGGETDAPRLEAALRERIQNDAPLGEIDYAEIVDAENLGAIENVSRPALAAVAVHFGKARLIDNIELSPL